MEHKLIVVGDSAVGKSSLIKRITTNSFTDDHQVTLGTDFAFFDTKVEEKKVRL